MEENSLEIKTKFTTAKHLFDNDKKKLINRFTDVNSVLVIENIIIISSCIHSTRDEMIIMSLYYVYAMSEY